MQIVWFKRDLRLEDNETLSLAAENGPVLLLYIVEPELWKQPDLSYRQYTFLKDSLNELRQNCQDLGHELTLKVGDAVQILESIRQLHPNMTLWSHQETWNGWTYERDKNVKIWAEQHGIKWHEPTQHGVVRRLQNRDGWAASWYRQMSREPLGVPMFNSISTISSDEIPSATELGLHEERSGIFQTGGRSNAKELLDSFLNERGSGYTREMSSPVTAYESCSRLSAHLAFGTLSIRETFRHSEDRAKSLRGTPREIRGKWPSALKSFSARLRWHCHFIQKLEDEPEIEFYNMHRDYDGLREQDFNADLFAAWKDGITGYPMVDACMRALTETGWLNFRMRAMLMSFASYHLWLHWRETSLHLARLFTDYEPGIHYCQAQMQSGTTGINSIRIYNPIKQGLDHDPEGKFIRQWIPELYDMPNEFIHCPWKASSKMNGYPFPIVDEKVARKSASDRIFAVRKTADHRAQAKRVFDKHGSRKPRRRTKTPATHQNRAQGELPL